MVREVAGATVCLAGRGDSADPLEALTTRDETMKTKLLPLLGLVLLLLVLLVIITTAISN